MLTSLHMFAEIHALCLTVYAGFSKPPGKSLKISSLVGARRNSCTVQVTVFFLSGCRCGVNLGFFNDLGCAAVPVQRRSETGNFSLSVVRLSETAPSALGGSCYTFTCPWTMYWSYLVVIAPTCN